MSKDASGNETQAIALRHFKEVDKSAVQSERSYEYHLLISYFSLFPFGNSPHISAYAPAVHTVEPQ